MCTRSSRWIFLMIKWGLGVGARRTRVGSVVVPPDFGNITRGALESACDDGVGLTSSKFKTNNLRSELMGWGDKMVGLHGTCERFTLAGSCYANYKDCIINSAFSWRRRSQPALFFLNFTLNPLTLQYYRSSLLFLPLLSSCLLLSPLSHLFSSSLFFFWSSSTFTSITHLSSPFHFQFFLSFVSLPLTHQLALWQESRGFTPRKPVRAVACSSFFILLI